MAALPAVGGSSGAGQTPTHSTLLAGPNGPLCLVRYGCTLLRARITSPVIFSFHIGVKLCAFAERNKLFVVVDQKISGMQMLGASSGHQLMLSVSCDQCACQCSFVRTGRQLQDDTWLKLSFTGC